MKNNTGIIYCAINKVNNKTYIGKTWVSLEKRKRIHISLANKNKGFYFQKALRKYGINNFIWSVLDHASTEKELSDLEKLYIDMFGSSFKGRGYNLTLGGEGTVPNEETRQKLSKLHKGKKLSEDQINFLKSRCGEKASWFGRNHTKETKNKISEKLKGKPKTESHKNNMYKIPIGTIPWNKGLALSEKTKDLLRVRNKFNKSVINIDTGETFISISEASRISNIPRQSINACCLNQIKKQVGLNGST